MRKFPKAVLAKLFLGSALVFLSACGVKVIEVSDLASTNRSDNADLFKIDVDDNLLSADQVYASMSELTGVAPAGAVLTEWQNNSRTSLADNYKVASLSAPLLMASANLGSRFCNQTLDTEIAMAGTARRLYNAIDFARGPSSVTEEAYSSATQNMSKKLWGRDLNADELSAFQSFRAGFMAEYSNTEMNQAARTKSLMLGVCTAFLASYEALTL